MKELKELIQEINENPACMTDVDWKEATDGFSQKCLEQLMEDINDLEVMKEVTELIKLRHKRAVKEVDECLFVHYAPDSTFTDDDGVTRPNPDAGKPEWNMPVEYYTEEWVHYGNKRLKEWIGHDIDRFLDILIEKRALELETQTKKETIRRKYSEKDVARCNATQDFSENQDENTEEDVAATCNANNEVIEKIRSIEGIDENQLATIFAKLRKNGLLNRDSKPNVSWSKAARMAKGIESKMNTSFEWKIWEILWDRPHIRQDYNHWNKLRDQFKKEDFEKRLLKALE